jgi:hypothetical protein
MDLRGLPAAHVRFFTLAACPVYTLVGGRTPPRLLQAESSPGQADPALAVRLTDGLDHRRRPLGGVKD